MDPAGNTINMPKHDQRARPFSAVCHPHRVSLKHAPASRGTFRTQFKSRRVGAHCVANHYHISPTNPDPRYGETLRGDRTDSLANAGSNIDQHRGLGLAKLGD
ncbi:predicted protein [Plenodomus lingam JN3]|uniref:Predicted protein n=1 Tax=Leptosphaeria maculans (strain JN3 / isolate v23.1.3 / race Av1-4-5-6-7-8) TaxID=985895 RepID=E5A5Q4_LEPMJ|nr:predicted protein [Plenodomus lingam JN3]CBX98952.1 predicted protein [Plenodomus lingam JN3]